LFWYIDNNDNTTILFDMDENNTLVSDLHANKKTKIYIYGLSDNNYSPIYRRQRHSVQIKIKIQHSQIQRIQQQLLHVEM
jgi:hypothetical protein